MKIHYSIFALALLAGCNSMYVKPNTLDTTQTIYADRGGYAMRRGIKEAMEDRGYNVVVGKATKSGAFFDGNNNEDIDYGSYNVMDARYIVKTTERRETFLVPWCIFNGFWWWNFNVSIADQKTGEEILSWRGRGCANSSIDKLNTALDKLEIKKM